MWGSSSPRAGLELGRWSRIHFDLTLLYLTFAAEGTCRPWTLGVRAGLWVGRAVFRFLAGGGIPSRLHKARDLLWKEQGT